MAVDQLMFKKANDLWFEDGSVVLYAYSSGGELLHGFRVHRTMLAAHSEVFADLFTMSNPAGEEECEGCPVVQMQDTSEDLTHFLKAVYDFRYVLREMQLDIDEDWAAMSGILRLSSKYGIQSLRGVIIDKLLVYYPISLDGYDQDSHLVLRMPASSRALDVILLARQTRALHLLPCAFYRAVTRGPADVVAGLTDPSALRLSDTDLRAWIVGHHQLCLANRTIVCSYFFNRLPDTPGCISTAHACFNRYFSAFLGLHRRGISTGPLCFYKMPWETLSPKIGCAACLAKLKELHEEGRKKVWNQLPEYFNLGSWDELLRDTS